MMSQTDTLNNDLNNDHIDHIDDVLSKEPDFGELSGYIYMACWVCKASKDLDHASQELATTASMSLEQNDFKSAAVAFRSAYDKSRNIRQTSYSDLFTPYEMILLELILYTEVQ